MLHQPVHAGAAANLPANIPELTSVRFFAALFVVLFHIHDRTPLLQDAPTYFFLKGYLGVDIFFILSGFILVHVYLAAHRAGTFAYGPFMLNRFARVYPLHLTMTFAFVALYTVSSRIGLISAGEGMSWSALPAHFAAVHAWGFVDRHAWNFPSWSISAEFFAYLLFPLFLVATRLGARIGMAVAVLALAAAFLVCARLDWHFTALTFDFGIIRIFFEFAFGVFLYLACAQTKLRDRTARWLLAATVAAFVLLAHWGGNDLALILLGGGIIFLLGQCSRTGRASLLRSKPLVYLGEISYSTYMIHFMVELVFVGLVSRWLGTPETVPLAAWFALLAVIWIGSVASYHIVEVPARNFIRGLARRRTAPATS